jgi:hypothetical protein
LRKLESEAHVPIMGDIIPAIFAASYGRQDDIYVWPAAFAKDPKNWTSRDLADLRRFNDEDAIRAFRRGGYLGWRSGIDAHGRWKFLIAGD